MRRAGPWLLLAALALVLALAQAETVLNFTAAVLITALAGQGWNILGGYGGQLSFGHAAFFGAGAYADALLQQRYGVPAWPAAALAVAVGAGVGVVIGGLSFRAGLRGSYFALVTLAFAEVFRIAANAAGFTGGAAGLLLRLEVSPGNFQFASRRSFGFVALAAVAAALGLTASIARSRFGAQLAAVRENEDAARALGIDPFWVKLRAIALSAAVTAAAGVLYVQYYLFINADLAFGAAVSVMALLSPVVGGLGTVTGPVLGALALHGAGEALRGVAGARAGMEQVAFGTLLVLAIAFVPGGLARLRWRQGWRQGRGR